MKSMTTDDLKMVRVQLEGITSRLGRTLTSSTSHLFDRFSRNDGADDDVDDRLEFVAAVSVDNQQMHLFLEHPEVGFIDAIVVVELSEGTSAVGVISGELLVDLLTPLETIV